MSPNYVKNVPAIYLGGGGGYLYSSKYKNERERQSGLFYFNTDTDFHVHLISYQEVFLFWRQLIFSRRKKSSNDSIPHEKLPAMVNPFHSSLQKGHTSPHPPSHQPPSNIHFIPFMVFLPYLDQVSFTLYGPGLCGVNFTW